MNKNIMVTSIILSQFFTAGCSSMVDSAGYPSFGPMPLLLRNLPQGNDIYALGFRNGCYSQVGIDGVGPLRMYSTHSPNPPESLRYPELYRLAYTNGSEYCGPYVNPGTTL